MLKHWSFVSFCNFKRNKIGNLPTTTRGFHKVNFPLFLQLLNHYCVKWLQSCDRVPLLQQLKMEALIPAPIDSKVQSVIKFLNAQSIALIEIHCQMCQVYGHTRFDGQHISCCEVFNQHPPYSLDLTPSDFHNFFHLKKFLYGQCWKGYIVGFEEICSILVACGSLSGSLTNKELLLLVNFELALYFTLNIILQPLVQA